MEQKKNSVLPLREPITFSRPLIFAAAARLLPHHHRESHFKNPLGTLSRYSLSRATTPLQYALCEDASGRRWRRRWGSQRWAVTLDPLTVCWTPGLSAARIHTCPCSANGPGESLTIIIITIIITFFTSVPLWILSARESPSAFHPLRSFIIWLSSPKV